MSGGKRKRTTVDYERATPKEISGTVRVLPGTFSRSAKMVKSGVRNRDANDNSNAPEVALAPIRSSEVESTFGRVDSAMGNIKGASIHASLHAGHATKLGTTRSKQAR